MSEGPSFWDELKQRRVVRVGVVYAAVAWLLVQASQALEEIVGLPDAFDLTVLVAVVLGFPLTLVIAWAFQVTDQGVERAPAASGRTSSRMAFLGGLTVGVVSIAAVAFILAGPEAGTTPPGAGELDHDRVVIYPLRAQVPPDLERLGDGLSDLLSSIFTGEVGPTAVSFGTVSSAAQGGAVDAETVARTLGAGLVASGSVVGSASHVVVQIELRHVDDAEPPIPARAQAHPDSITWLTDQLAAQLLGLEAGEYREAIPYLSQNVDAVKRYLAGRQAWRSGGYWDAVAEFNAAITADSTFALAAIARADAANMALGAGVTAHLELADRHRDRLGPRDQLYLDTRLGPAELQTRAQRLADWEAFTVAVPDRVEGWYFQGETYMHGRFWGHSDWAERAVAIFDRALELDPQHFPSLEHVWFIRANWGTPAQVQTVAARMVEIGGPGCQWIRGVAEGNGELSLNVDELRELTDQYLSLAMLTPVAFPDLAPSDFLPYLEAAVAEGYRRAVTADVEEAVLAGEVSVNRSLGRPARVRALMERRASEFGWAPSERTLLADVLWGVGHPGMAVAAEAGLRRRLAAKPTAEYDLQDVYDLTALETADFVRDPEYTGGEAAGILRDAFDRVPEARRLGYEAHALTFEAWRAMRLGEPGVDEMIGRLDGILRQGPSSYRINRHFHRLAFMLEEHGAPARALDMLDRRGVFALGQFGYMPELWEWSGRLAEQIGDTERAIKEYRRYVKIRQHAGPELQPELERVRGELARLEGR